MNDEEVVRIGDKMYVSVELIEQIKENPDQRTVLVELVKIKCNPDNTKILYFKNVQT